MHSVNRRIFFGAAVIGLCTLAAKGIGALKEVILASQFGVGPELDAFLLGYLFPTFVINILSGSLQAAFVPKYLAAWQQQGEAAARRLAASTAGFLLVALFVAALLIAPISVVVLPAISAQLPLETLRSAQAISAILTPLIVINGLMYFWAGVLNSHDRFASAALIPAFTPLAIGMSALMYSDSAGAYALVAGALVGAVAELVLIMRVVRSLGQSPLFARASFDSTHRAMLAQFSAAAMGNLVLGATLIVDQSFAASLGAGGVSALSFGTKLTQVVAGVFAMALATAVLPNVSRLVANNDWSGIRNTMRAYVKLIALITVPMTVLFVVFSPDICRLLFERGNFDAADTEVVSRVQALYALQIPFFSVGMVAVRILSALSANHMLLIGAVVSLTLDIALNFILVPILGVSGIALATSIMYFVGSIYLVAAATHRLTLWERAAGAAA